MSSGDCDLLVVGLGPTGDVLAGLAALHGLSVIAIDKAADIHHLPRAAVFDHEIMRIFQMLGVAQHVAPLCRIPNHYRFVTRTRAVLLDFELADLPTVSGWAPTYALHQPGVEAVLRGRLGELGVDCRVETGFLGLRQEDTHVTSEVAGPQGRYTIRSRYVVGCDGASSAVRDTIGMALFDYKFDEPWLVVDVIAPESAGLPVDCMQICDPARPVTYLAMSPPRYRWEFMLKPGEDPAQITSDESVAKLLAPWHPTSDVIIERKAVYRFHGLVAERWRDRRVFVAGDAAHQMPPFAGQGMCSGIRDAGNLAWKLALAVWGRAGDGLLDSYQTEREPHARAIIETAIGMGRVVCLLDEEAAALRDAEMLARKATGAKDVAHDYPPLKGGCLTDSSEAGGLFPQPVTVDGRLDDGLPPGAWLIGHDLPADLPDGIARIDLAVSSIPDSHRAHLARWLDQHEGRAVLVRPDRHVFGLESPRKLLDQWESKLNP